MELIWVCSTVLKNNFLICKNRFLKTYDEDQKGLECHTLNKVKLCVSNPVINLDYCFFWIYSFMFYRQPFQPSIDYAWNKMKTIIQNSKSIKHVYISCYIKKYIH